MRIDPGSPNIPPVPGRSPGRPYRRAPSTDASPEQIADSGIPAEIASFMAGLVEVVDVRMDVVEEVRQRLNRGELLSRDAAEKTASAILADLASFIGQ